MHREIFALAIWVFVFSWNVLEGPTKSQFWYEYMNPGKVPDLTRVAIRGPAVATYRDRDRPHFPSARL